MSPSAGYRSSPSHRKPFTPPSSSRPRNYTPKNYGDDSGESFGRSPRASPYKSHSPSSSSPYSTRPIHTMVSNGGITATKVSIYVNASRCKLDTKRFSELLKFIVSTYIAPHRDPTSGLPRKSLRILKFDVSSNLLDDGAIAKFIGFCRQHAGFLTIKSLKLYQNMIGDVGTAALADLIARDDGPTFHELHLSHNRITTKGALSLLSSLADCSRYPFGKHQEKRLTPLWLRLEHNFISANDCVSLLNEKKVCTCYVNAKGTTCTPSQCQTPNSKLHLVFLHFQYWNETLETAKRAMQMMRASRDPEPNSTNDGSMHMVEAAGQSIGNDAQRPISSVVGATTTMTGSQSKKDCEIQAGPLYLFMDTNAVVTAVLEPNHPWSLRNLKRRFESNQFGTSSSSETVVGAEGNNAIDERVVLVVTDTVLGELDGMHKKKVIKASVVNEMLMDAEKSGYLMMLGAHQGEKLVQALDVGSSSSTPLGLDVTTSNDRMIVDIALMFAEELGDAHCAMFISEDHGARLTARNRGLCVVSMSQLQNILFKHDKDVWSPQHLRSWFLAAAPTKSMTNANTANVQATQSPSPSSSSSSSLLLSNVEGANGEAQDESATATTSSTTFTVTSSSSSAPNAASSFSSTSATSTNPSSNPITQLRALKRNTIKALDLSRSLTVDESQRPAHEALNALLEQMETALQNISVLPALISKTKP